MPTAEFPRWLEERRRAHAFSIERIPFSKLDNWGFEPTTGNLAHYTGRFFKIEGVWVETNYGDLSQWSQPIINQPEVGILGIITRKIKGSVYFLMQAKMEPGNIGEVQLAPTLQATRSNFTRVHRGKTPPYLECFLGGDRFRTVVDVLQSEQGARFYRKRNRNVIVEALDDVPVRDDYCWLTLSQIRQLAAQDNIVNMCARTVLACLPSTAEARAEVALAAAAGANGGALASAVRDSLFDSDNSLHSVKEILTWFTQLKFRYELNVERMPLKYVRDWVRTDDSISHKDGKFFSVIGVRVEADSREAPRWSQPLIKPREEGVVAFVMKRFRGAPHFLVQAKVEPGNFDVLEMAPTVQCVTGSYRDEPPERRPPFLHYVLEAPPSQVRMSSLQSEEGGRFYREANRNLIIEAGSDFPEELPDRYIWMTLQQLKTFIQFNNFVNVQARCLLAGLGCL